MAKKMWAFGGNAREDEPRTFPRGASGERSALANAPAPRAAKPAAISELIPPPAAEPAPEMPPKADPILNVVRYLARRWGRPESPDVILAGLPVVDGLLTLKLLPRALDRVGLLVKTARMPLKSLADFDMPAIVANKGGRLLVIVERSARNKLLCFDPVQGAEVEIQTNSKEWRYRHQMLLVKQQDERETAGEADRPGLKQHWLKAALAGHGKSIALVLLAATFINVFALAMPMFSMNV